MSWLVVGVVLIWAVVVIKWIGWVMWVAIVFVVILSCWIDSLSYDHK